MMRAAIIAALLVAGAASAPSLAVTKKDKEATCRIGADSQNLQGEARAKFMKNCMADRNDPRGPAGGGGAPPPKN